MYHIDISSKHVLSYSYYMYMILHVLQFPSLGSIQYIYVCIHLNFMSVNDYSSVYFVGVVCYNLDNSVQTVWQ